MWTLKNQALVDCIADENCKNAMEKQKGEVKIPESSSSEEVDTSSNSEEGANNSSSSVKIIINRSSASQVISEVNKSSSSSETSVVTPIITSSSSNSSLIGPSLKYCNPTPVTIVKGNSASWAFKTNGDPANTYNWTFEGGDIETSAEANPSVLYKNVGSYSASVETDVGDKTNCSTKIKVVGPDVTGCVCSSPTYNPSSADLKDASPVTVTWTVNGCSSVDGLGNEQDLTYTWSGTGVTGNATAGTGKYTEMGSYSASVTVKNSDGDKFTNVTCSAKIIDNTPFKCNAGNSSPMPIDESDANKKAEQQITANACYSYKVSKQYANLQFGQWSGITQTLYYIDCNGTKGTVSLNTNDFTEVTPGGINCSIYFYPKESFNFQIQMW